MARSAERIQAIITAAEAQLDRLLAGEPLVRLVVGGVDKTFSTVDSLEQFIANMQGQLANAQAGNVTYAAFRRPS